MPRKWKKAARLQALCTSRAACWNFAPIPESPYHDKNFAKSKTVIVYCASGGRSALSGKVLKDMGYDQVYNLGAFKDWAESGGAVDKPIEPGR